MAASLVALLLSGYSKKHPDIRCPADMRLHFRVQGDGRPLLILHGLLGSLDNWQSMSKRLAAQRRVYSLDLRNHGHSPHSEIMNYTVMAQDVREFCEEHDIRAPAVLGHSMGGKVAMQLAAHYPDQIDKLLIVDIAPKEYTLRYTGLCSRPCVSSIFAAIDPSRKSTPPSRRRSTIRRSEDLS